MIQNPEVGWLTEDMIWSLILVAIFLAFTLFTYSFIWIAQRFLLVQKKKSARRWREQLTMMFIFFDTSSILYVRIALALLLPAVMYLVSGSVILSVIGCGVGACLPDLILKLLKKMRLKNFQVGLPDALAQVAGSMRAGATFINAIDIMSQETVGPIGEEFTLLVREYRLGKGISEVFGSLCERVPLDDLLIVKAATDIASEIGGNLAETFERLAKMLQQKRMMEDKIDSLTAQGKLQGIVVGLLPVGMIAVICFIEPVMPKYLFYSFFGWAFLCVITVLIFMGGSFIKKIVTIDV